MPRKPNIESLLKRSARVRALAWCTERVNKVWGEQGDAPRFTEEEQETLWKSFSTEREYKILEKIRYQEGQLRHFFPLISHRMTQVIESANAFDLIRSRYLESLVHEKLVNEILEKTKKHVTVHNIITKICKYFDPNALTFSPPSTTSEYSTIALKPYSGKSFIGLLDNEAFELRKRIQMTKAYIEAAQKYINATRCHITFYDKKITDNVKILKSYIELVNDTPKKLEDYKKQKLLILEKAWLRPHYDDIPVDENLYDAGCFRGSEATL